MGRNRRRNGLIGALPSPQGKDSAAPPFDLRKPLGFGTLGREKDALGIQDRELPADLDRWVLRKLVTDLQAA